MYFFASVCVCVCVCVRQCKYLLIINSSIFCDIKVSGIPSGNKLIKTIRYFVKISFLKKGTCVCIVSFLCGLHEVYCHIMA